MLRIIESTTDNHDNRETAHTSYKNAVEAHGWYLNLWHSLQLRLESGWIKEYTIKMIVVDNAKEEVAVLQLNTSYYAPKALTIRQMLNEFWEKVGEKDGIK
jgi:hypothetical protein